MDVQIEIKKVEAFEIRGKLFSSIELALKYQTEVLDDVNLGDIVSTLGFRSLYGDMGLEGRACCIEDEGKTIWFVKGNCPEKIIMSGELKQGGRNYDFEGLKYNWSICCRRRSDLFRRSLKSNNESYMEELNNLIKLLNNECTNK